MRDVAVEVKRIVKERLEDVNEAQITPEASFVADLGADSLHLVELTLACEEVFEIDIPDEDAENIKTVGECITYVEEHMKG